MNWGLLPLLATTGVIWGLLPLILLATAVLAAVISLSIWRVDTAPSEAAELNKVLIRQLHEAELEIQQLRGRIIQLNDELVHKRAEERVA